MVFCDKESKFQVLPLFFPPESEEKKYYLCGLWYHKLKLASIDAGAACVLLSKLTIYSYALCLPRQECHGWPGDAEQPGHSLTEMEMDDKGEMQAGENFYTVVDSDWQCFNVNMNPEQPHLQVLQEFQEDFG